MDIEASYFKEVKNERFEKFKMLASGYRVTTLKDDR
jgi:hypothetical protein